MFLKGLSTHSFGRGFSRLMGPSGDSLPGSTSGSLMGLLFGALCVVVLGISLVPLTGVSTAVAQEEEGRVVVVVEPTGRKASKIANKYLDAFFETAHVIFTEEEVIFAGENEGITEDAFWEDPVLMAQVANVEGYDALVMSEISNNGRSLTISIFDARSGDQVGEFDIDLDKKRKFGRRAKRDLLEMLNPFLLDTGGIPEPTTVDISVTTTPLGAEVFRDNVSLGITPFTLTYDRSDLNESWEVRFDGEKVGVLRVSFAESKEYTLAFGEEEDSSEPTEGSYSGLPFVEISAGVSLNFRGLDVSVIEGNELVYSSGMYPVFSINAAFFPISRQPSMLAGLGAEAFAGIGFLGSSIPKIIGSNPLFMDPLECEDVGDLYNCGTTHTEFGVNLVYRWLFKSNADGSPDRNSLFLKILVGYNWLVFGIDPNPTYVGHGYQGVRTGLGFNTPLGIDALRIGLDFAFVQNFSFGSAEMIGNWGLTASGYGMLLDADLSYQIYGGLFAEVGYNFAYFLTTYEGTGCQNEDCTLPLGAEAVDNYHQIRFGLGYRFD